MPKGTNEVNKGEEIAIEGGMSSLRRKYLKSGQKFSRFGKGDLSMDSGEQVLSIKKEIRTQKGGKSGGESSTEQVTELKKIKINGAGRESSSAGKLSISRQNGESKNDSGEGKITQSKQTITKIEISNGSENTSSLRANKSVSNNNSSNQKGRSTSKITKTTEITTTTNISSINQGNDRSIGKNEVTTTTTTTKTSRTQRNSPGNKEVVKTTTTKEGGNSSRKTGTKAELTSTKTTTKTTTSNQKSPARTGGNTQNQVTTTKTTTTITNNSRGGNDKKVVSSQSTSRINNKNESNKNTTTNQRSLIAQKSTPTLRGNNALPNKDNLKNDKKRPLSSIPQESEFRNNISRISIDETGKIPKKEYVLNVRKTDVIQRKNKIRMVYNNDPNAKNILQTEFNHNIKVIKNTTRDLPTVESLPVGAKIIHRYNFSFNPNIPNTVRHEIDETGKIPVKQVQVSPRKNNVIKTERKPLKMTYENYNNNQQGGTKIIPLPNNLRNKKDLEQGKKMNVNESKKINIKGAEDTSTSTRIRSQASNNRNKAGETTTTTTKVTETRITRGKSESGNPKGKSGETKITITKTIESKSGKGGQELKITRNNDSPKKDNRGDRSSKKSKMESVTTSQISVNESGKGNRNKSEGKSDKKEEKTTTTSKVTVTKTTESSNGGGSGSIRLRFGKGGADKEETKVTKTKTEGSKITTTTTTTKVETSEGGDGVAKVKKFRSHRMFKK